MLDMRPGVSLCRIGALWQSKCGEEGSSSLGLGEEAGSRGGGGLAEESESWPARAGVGPQARNLHIYIYRYIHINHKHKTNEKK